jgi:L-fuculose-phosphate aldolase
VSTEARAWETDARRAIADVCHRLYERRYLVATSGNVSLREADGFLVTPASMRKDAVTPEMIVACGADGAALDPAAHASSEATMHRDVYRARPDVKAAIHAHPQHCLACSLAGIALTEMLLPELAVYLGPVPVVPYATPGTEEMGEALRPFLQAHNAFLLARHGVLVLGKDLQEAYNRMEHLEHIAHVAYLARAAGQLTPMAKGDLEKLVRQAKRLGHHLSHRILDWM